MGLVSHLEVPFGDSAAGIAEAAHGGHAACDLNIRTCKATRWPLSRRRIVLVHWTEWWKHGFEPVPGAKVPRKPIEKLTLAQVGNLRSKVGHRPIITAERALLLCRGHGIIPFFEMKPSIWNAQVLVDLRNYGQKIRHPFALMTIQSYGKTPRARDAWERAAFSRMKLAKSVGCNSVLIFRRSFDRAKWGPVLVGIKDHAGFGGVLATAPLIRKLRGEYK